MKLEEASIGSRKRICRVSISIRAKCPSGVLGPLTSLRYAEQSSINDCRLRLSHQPDPTNQAGQHPAQFSLL